MPVNFQKSVLEELSRFFEPLVNASQSTEGIIALLDQLGWRAANLEADDAEQYRLIVAALADFAKTGGNYTEFLKELDPAENPLESIAHFAAALSKADAAIRSVIALSTVGSGSALDQLGEDLLGFLTVEYLRARAPALVPLFILLTLLRVKRVDAIPPDGSTPFLRDPHSAISFNPGRLVSLLQDPVAELKAEYPLEGDQSDLDKIADKLFLRIADLGQTLGLPVFYGLDPLDFEAGS